MQRLQSAARGPVWRATVVATTLSFSLRRALLLPAAVSPQRWASSDRAAAATARWAAAPLLRQLATTGSIDVVAEHYSKHKYSYDVPTHIAAANRICALDKDRTLKGLIMPHLLTLEKFIAPFLSDLPLAGHLSLLYMFATYGRELPPKLHKQIATQVVRSCGAAGGGTAEVLDFLAWCGEGGFSRELSSGTAHAYANAFAHFDCLAGPTEVINEGPRSLYTPPEAPQPVVNALWALARHGMVAEAFPSSSSGAEGVGQTPPQGLGPVLLERLTQQLVVNPCTEVITNEALLRGAWAAARFCGGAAGESPAGQLPAAFGGALAAAVAARDPGLLAPLQPAVGPEASPSTGSKQRGGEAVAPPRVLRARARAAGASALTAGSAASSATAPPPVPSPPAAPPVFSYPQRVLLLWCLASVGVPPAATAVVQALAAQVYGIPGFTTQADTAGGLQTASPATLQLLKQTLTLLSAQQGTAVVTQKLRPLPAWATAAGAGAGGRTAATNAQAPGPISLTEHYEPPPHDAVGMRSVAAALAPRASPADFALQSVAAGLKQAGARARRGYVIDGFSVDFAMPDTHVALDLTMTGAEAGSATSDSDGSPSTPRSAAADAQKAAYLSAAGWRYVQLDYQRWRGMSRGDKLGTLIHLIANEDKV